MPPALHEMGHLPVSLILNENKLVWTSNASSERHSSQVIAYSNAYRGGDVESCTLLGTDLVLHSSASIGETEVCCCTGLGASHCLCFVEKY